MDSLPLAVIGWMFTVVSAAALLFGAWLIVGMHLGGEEGRRHLAKRVLDDTILFGIWILGLAGGIAVLLGKAWGMPVLEFFCWVLIILVLLSAWSRLRASVPPRAMLIVSIVLFALPIILVCAATIVTLRSDAVRALAG